MFLNGFNFSAFIGCAEVEFCFLFGFSCAVYWQVFALQNWAWFFIAGNSYSLLCFWLLVFFSGFIEFVFF